MRYCIKYSPKNHIANDLADELIIFYNKSNRSLADILNKYDTKTCIIDIVCADDMPFDANDLRLWRVMFETFPTIKLRLELDFVDKYKSLFDEIVSSNIPFFFSNYAYSWDTLYNLIGYAPSDVYITQELGFELDKIAALMRRRDIKIRVFPNVAQSGCKHLADIKRFFIRPEDIDFYSSFVDVCEFFGQDHKASVYLQIYKEDKKWFGQLKEIIIGYKSNIDSRFIIPTFAKVRVRCGRKCLKGSNCKICDRIEEAAETLKDNNLLIKK